MKTITTNEAHGFTMGETITLIRDWKPWYIRLWRWITRYQPPRMVVTQVTATTITISGGGIDLPYLGDHPPS